MDKKISLEQLLVDTNLHEKICLSPFVEIEPFFGMDDKPLPLQVGHLTGLFIDKDFALAYAPLIQQLRSAANAMLKNALTRGKVPDKMEMLKVLHNICIAQCGQGPLSQLLEAKRDVHGKFHLTIKQIASLQRGVCQFPQVTFKIRHRSHSQPENFIEPSFQDFPHVAKFFRKLNHGIEKEELIEAFLKSSNHGVLKSVLTTLFQMNAFAFQKNEKPDWDRIMPSCSGLSAYHFGHASLLIRCGDSFAAVDPWFLCWDPRYHSQPLSAQQLPPLEAIFITHHHWDHINPQSVLQYPENIPIVVPKQNKNLSIYPNYEGFLNLFGCERVIELEHWQKFQLKDGGFVMAVPFLGEGTLEEKFQGNCYLVERGGQRVLLHVDSSPDSSGQSDISQGIIQKLVRENGPIDLVYATRRQELNFGIESWQLFPIVMADKPDSWLEAIENCNCTKEYLADLAKETRCKMLLLYSEGGAEWYTDQTDFLRSGKEDPLFEANEYLWDTFEDIQSEVSKRADCPLHLSEPMSLVTLESGKINISRHWITKTSSH